MRTELVIRFDYGSVVPWVRRIDDATLVAVGGPDGLMLRTPVELEPERDDAHRRVHVDAGERVPFVLTWFPSHRASCRSRSTPSRRSATPRAFWRDWIAAAAPTRASTATRCTSSLAVLKALTYAPTGGIVAAPTTSLPELHRRRAQLGLPLLLAPRRDVHALRADERRLHRRGARLARLAAARGRRRPRERPDPLRRRRRAARSRAGARLAAGLRGLGAGAGRQRRARAVPARRLRRGDGRAAPGARARPDRPTTTPGRCSAAIMDFLEGAWDEPDEGIWEVRGPRRHFTHSKVLAWVAFDRAVRPVERFGLPGPVDRWRRLRGEIHDEVCREAFNTELNSFTQAYGSDELDASTLLIPLVGFLPARRPARARHDRRDPARPDARRLRRALPHARRTTTSTGCPAARACSCRARSGSSTRS